MGETFLIDINCSKVLTDGDETQFKMFIDSSKMSIVYELVEWIRWMFSLKNCFYITHENAVIHELEDIQLLSRLKKFELKPCGRTNCSHKKLYRSLLKKLNLFVCMNGTQVHRDFLHKISQIDQKFIQDSSTSSTNASTLEINNIQSFKDVKNTKFNESKNITYETEKYFLSEDSQPKTSSICKSPVKKKALIDSLETNWGENYESSTEIKCHVDKRVVLNGDTNGFEEKLSCLADVSNTAAQNPESKKNPAANTVNTSSQKNDSKGVQQPTKNGAESCKKFIKPFTLGEVLSNLRESFEEKRKEPNGFFNSLEESNFDEKIATENLINETESNKVKKRNRTRKRKRKSKSNDEFASYWTASPTEASFNMNGLNSGTKPNHVRFDSDEEMEDEFKTENQATIEFNGKDLNNFDPFLQNECQKALKQNQHLSEADPDSFEISYTNNEMDFSTASELTSEDKLKLLHQSLKKGEKIIIDRFY